MTKDMTVGNPIKLILMFSIPLLIGNIFQQFYSMVDTIIVGQFVGYEALAAVGAITSLNFLVLGLVIGLANGFAIPIAQSFGSGDEDRLRHYVVMSIYLCAIATILITIISVKLMKPILILMKTPDDIFEDAYKYICIICLGTIATTAYNMLSGILRALGDSKTPLYFLIIASILNIILDLFFVVILKTGVAGAAYATVISQGVAAILCAFYMFKKFKILRFHKKDAYFKISSALQLVKMGIPMALQYVITATGAMILQSTINSFGSVVVAGYTAALKVEQLAIQPLISFGVTMATYTGQNLGAQKFDRIKEGVFKCIVISIALCIVGGILIHIYGINLINMFLTDPAPEIVISAEEYLNTISMFFIPLGVLFIFRNTLQGLGDGFTPMMAGVCELVGRVAIALVFSNYFGYTAVCYAGPVAWIAAALLLVVSYIFKVKKFKAAT